MGRHGSATNYWLEPTLATATLLALGPAWNGGSKIASTLRVVLPAIVIAVSIGPMQDALRAWDRDRRFLDNALAATRRHCPHDATRSWMASIAALELDGTGRIATFEFGLGFALRRGEWKLESLERVLLDPANRCFVHWRDLRVPFVLESPESEVTLWDGELRPLLLEHFALAEESGGIWIYERVR